VASEAQRYRGLMENRGLRVTERRGRQLTLDGKSLNYHNVTGVREGGYKVTVRLEPGPTSIHVVVNASSKEKARTAARRLEELGFRVEVDEERVRASTRRAGIQKLSKAIDIAEEATRTR